MDAIELSSKFINKIPQKTSQLYYIFKSVWQSNEISLEIVDDHLGKQWSGSIFIEDLKQSAEELEIPYEKFFNECKDALTRNGGVESFEYLLEDDKFILIKTDEFHIQYLEVIMKPIGQQQDSVNINAVDLIEFLRCELSGAKQQSRDLNEKYQTLETNLKKCLEEKNHIERNLLRKFSVLLNSKKDKIAELQDLLVEKNNMLQQAGISDTESSKRNLAAMQGDSIDNGDDFMQATQLMTQPVVTLPKRRKFNAADEAITRRKSFTKEIAATSSTFAIEKESVDEATKEIVDSPDIFDQIQ